MSGGFLLGERDGNEATSMKELAADFNRAVVISASVVKFFSARYNLNDRTNEKGKLMRPMTVEATYENGVLRPIRPLPLAEQEHVEITIQSKTSWAQRTSGLLQWRGDLEVLQRVAGDEEFGMLEAP